jgi:UDP-N-acetylglucosamine:LPS N-acetylglucosamine transferase
LTFVVGGAGAQKEIGMTIIKSFKKLIQKNKIRINLVAGVRLDVVEYFRNAVKELDLEDKLDKNIMIIDGLNKGEYFSKFNEILHETDILWTKPSELSFYTALGIPIIISPPIGAHEFYNKKWLMQLGTGFPQEDLEYADEWLLDLLESGALAEGAFEGFMEAPNLGIYNIEKLIFRRRV